MKTSVVAVCISLMAFASCQKNTDSPNPVTAGELTNGGFESYLDGWNMENRQSFSASSQAAKSGKAGLYFVSATMPADAKIFQTVNNLADGEYTFSVYAEGAGSGMYLWADGGNGEIKVPIPQAKDTAHAMPLSKIDFTVKGGVAKFGFISIAADKGNLDSNAIVSEAETAAISGAVISSKNAGFTGGGFVDFINNSGDYVEWTINKATTSAAELTFRFAHGGATNRAMTLQVNDIVINPRLAFMPTGGWSSWGTVKETVNMISGVNKIKLTTRGFSGPDVDQIKIKSLEYAPYFYADDVTFVKK